MPNERKGTGRSGVLIVVLVVALAIGAAASLLIGVATRPGGPPPPVSELFLPTSVVAYGTLGFLTVLVGTLLYHRLTNPAAGFQGRTVLTLFAVILLLILFVAVFQTVSFGPPSPAGAVAPGTNTTSSSPPANASGTNLTPHGNVTPFLPPSVPGWVPFAVVSGVALLVALVVFPVARSFASDRRALRSAAPDRAAVRSAVRSLLASAELDLERTDDARQVIVALYGRILARLGALVGGTEPDTPEEIRTLHLLRLGIRPDAALTLTRLFEEARYSTHPLGRGHLEDARRAVREALSDLARTPEADPR